MPKLAGHNRLLLGVIVTGLVAIVGAADAQPFAASRTHAVGGVLPMATGPYSIRSTVGQGAAGHTYGGSYILRAGFWAITDASTSAVPPAVPGSFAISPVIPNPFTASQTASIRFELPVPDRVQVKVFDSRGRMVRVLGNGQLPAGSHELRWDARDERGRRVMAGVYFIEFRSGQEAGQRKVTLLP